jgi:hypothetical protein
MADDVVLTRLIETGTKWPALGLRVMVFAWGHTIEGTIIPGKEYDEGVAAAIDKAMAPSVALEGAARNGVEKDRDALKAAATSEGAKGHASWLFLKSVSVDGDKNLDRLRIPVGAVVGYALLEQLKEKAVNDGFLRR